MTHPLLYLAVFELSTTVTVLSWLTQARRLPEAEKETEWTQPPPPEMNKTARLNLTRGYYFYLEMNKGIDTNQLLQILQEQPQMASCCPRVWDLVFLPPP